MNGTVGSPVTRGILFLVAHGGLGAVADAQACIERVEAALWEGRMGSLAVGVEIARGRFASTTAGAFGPSEGLTDLAQLHGTAILRLT